jgi:autotransporter-associated beta strand protein
MNTRVLINSVLLISLLAVAPAPAANLTWDANPAAAGAQDGAGTWDNSANNWWTGSANAVFNNAAPDVPTFGSLNGTAGTITLGANITSGSLTFNPPSVGNYTIAGGGFSLALTNRTITANVNGTISANLVPTGAANSALTLANNGGAVLTLSGNNSFTNFNLGINAGNTTAAMRVGSSTALGWGNVGIAGGQGSATSHRIELVGTNLTITNTLANLGRNNSSAVVVNLGTSNTLAGTQIKTTGGQDTHWSSEVADGLTFSGTSGGGIALSSSAAAPRYYVLRGSGGGTVSGVISTGSGGLGIVKAGRGTWTLSGGPNTDAGGIILNEGVLNLDFSTQNNAKWAAASAVTLGGGTLSLNGGSFTQTNGSTVIAAGNSSVTRGGGSSVLRLSNLTRNRGGVVEFSAGSIADCNNNDVNGILGGGYATLGGADWAHTIASGAANTAITAYTGYTDIAASGSTIADGPASNVRLNSAGGGGNIVLGATTSSIQTLLQNTTTAATIDTASKTLRFGTNGGLLIPSGKSGVTIGTVADSGTVTAGGSAVNVAGEVVLINNSANDLLVNSVVADNGTGPVSLTKAGSGTATLAGSNTHTGTNSIVGGTLNISSDANLGAVPGATTPSSILINGGTLNATADLTLSATRGIVLGPTTRYGTGTIGVNSGVTFSVPGVIGNADSTGNGPGGSLTKTGNGTLVLGGANTYANGTFVNGGTLSLTASANIGPTPGCYIPDHLTLNGGTLEAAASFTLGSGRGIMLGPIGTTGTGTFQVDSGFTLQLDSRIADNWNGTGSLTKTGDGTLVLTGGLNEYSGNTTIGAGTLQVNHPRSLPNGAGKGNVLVNGTLALNGTNVAINGFSGNGTVDNISGNSATLNVGNNNQGGNFSGTIQNSGGGALTLTKSGSATVTLTGANNHGGSTVINSGTLALTGAATISSTTNIAISSGATLSVSGLAGGTLTLASGQVLSGNGTVVGAIDTGTGAIAPGTSAGTLAISGNLTLGNGSLLNYELANVTTTGGGVNDYTVVAGNLTVAGAVTLNLAYLNAIPAPSGKYTLFSYTGSFSGNVNDISVPSGFTISNNVAAKTVELLINHVSANLVWAGDGAGNVWDVNSTPNWSGGAFFFNGDTANFDNTGSATPAVNIAAPVIPAAVNVSGTQNYNFTGSTLASGSLVKSGGGTLTLENDSTFATSALVSGGTLQIGNAGGSGTIGGAATITNNAAIVANRADALVITNPMVGSGTFTQVGTGTTSLNASNSYAGVTTVAAGTLQVPNAWSLGSTAGGTVVSSGAQLYLTLNVNVDNEPLTIAGSGPASDGALRKGGGGASIFGGSVTLTANTTLKLDGNSTLSLTNASGINGAAANATLLLAGDGGSAGNILGPISLGTGGVINNGGTWAVSPTNNYAANTVINGGAYRISSPRSLGNQPGTWTPDRVQLNGGGLQVATNAIVNLNDGRIGINLTQSSVLGVDAGGTLNISNEISGAGAIQKWFPGLLILSGSNSYSGALYTDGNSNTANDGTTRITTSAALTGVTDIGIRNNNSGFSTLQFDGSAGSVVVPQPLTISCRNNPNPCLQNLAGSNVLTGGIAVQVGGADQWWQSDAGTLVFAGDINYAGSLTGGRIYHFQGSGDHLVTGNINASPLGSPISVTKAGPGALSLNGINTYGTTTTVSNGLLWVNGSISHTGAVTVVGGSLGGTGSITAPVIVQSGGTFSPGASIGTLTINNDLTLAGTTVIEVNKSNGSRDQVAGLGIVTYGGTLYATNLAGTPALGDSYAVFSATAHVGNFSGISGSPGNGLAWFFTNGVLSVVTGVANYSTNLTATVSGSTLSLSWPATHLGWILQSQTNTLGVGLTTPTNTWFDVSGSSAVTSQNITINPANPTVFFRLRKP